MAIKVVSLVIVVVSLDVVVGFSVPSVVVVPDVEVV